MARKRKPGPRTKNGRLSKALKKYPDLRDQGTQQASAKRQGMVGDGNDPALAATMPGILFARGWIDREAYEAALEYRRLRCALYGPPWPTNVLGGTATDERLATLRGRFERKVAALTLVQKIVISNVCVHDKMPMWLSRRLRELPERVVDKYERDALLDGLDALAGSSRLSRAA